MSGKQEETAQEGTWNRLNLLRPLGLLHVLVALIVEFMINLALWGVFTVFGKVLVS